MPDLIPWQILNSDLERHRAKVVEDWTALIDAGAGERECLAFLQENAGFFFCDIGRRVVAISELQLGADFRPDFVVAEDVSSYGFIYELIEIEAPGDSVYTTNGSPSAKLNRAFGQVQQWQAWLEQHRDTAKELLPSSEFWRHGRMPVTYSIVIGRRGDGTEWQHLRNNFADKVDISIRSFDYLTERARERGFSAVPILSSAEMDGVDPVVRNELANPFRMAIPSAAWRKASSSFQDFHMLASNAASILPLTGASGRLAPFLDDWRNMPPDVRDIEIARAKKAAGL